MVNLQECISYDEYIQTAKDEEKVFIEELDKQGILFEDELYKIRELKEKVKVMVITDTFCKDSATTMPFLIKLASLNKNIEVKFLKKQGNEQIFTESRIPTILRLNNNDEVYKRYIEFPEVVKEKIKDKSDEERKAIVEELRAGKYNRYIQEEIIDLLLK